MKGNDKILLPKHKINIVNIFLSWKVLVTVCPGGFPFCIERENKAWLPTAFAFLEFFPLRPSAESF